MGVTLNSIHAFLLPLSTTTIMTLLDLTREDKYQSLTSYSNEYSSDKEKYRIQFSFEGKCVGVSEENALIVSY